MIRSVHRRRARAQVGGSRPLRAAAFSGRLLRAGWMLAILAMMLAPLEEATGASGADASGAGQRLRLRLEHLPQPIDLEVQGERIHAREALPSFYERRAFAAAWSSDAGPAPRAFELMRSIRDSGSEGLEPADYHLEAIERLLSEERSGPGALADLDLLLSDAFLLLGAHLVSGRVDPVTFDPEWIAVRREVDLVAALDRAVSASGPSAELTGLLPPYVGYASLRDALSTYRRLSAAGGWTSIGTGPSLRPGDSDQRVVQLRRRLAATGDAPSSVSAETLYDESLERAVRSFQARHGLQEDGIVGAKTLAALNVPASERAEQLLLNLERWRWLPQQLGERHLLVNIAAFQLVLEEQGEAPQTTMRVAVGRSYRRTPVFSDRIRYLVLNPFWEVPQKLAVQDKLPEIRRDPGYLDRMGFKVFQGWGEAQRLVDPSTVDWNGLSRGEFPYRLRQDPGPLNALGKVKFMFPNRFNVYLHDTPTREVFEKPERDVSSGCIRVERPLELMDWLLRDTSRWDPASARAALATGRETVVLLDRPVPVHLLYWTAWVDDGGTVQFRHDVYERDAALATALERVHDLAG